ncbi:hypothetical protein Misp02_23220 [Microtetraspora sp. NBRC 16547]|nr:hypothetical protein Misp02_23220 [Microtetraspora sp. NBRC 16547]
MGDAVVAAGAIEPYLPALSEPLSELLAVVGEPPIRRPECPQRLGEDQAHPHARWDGLPQVITQWCRVAGGSLTLRLPQIRT